MVLEKIIKKLTDTQHKSGAPTEYEIALADAFRFLGFKAKKIGGKGDTDVLLTANVGRESYKVDVDGKTSKNDKVSEAQINWLSLKDHKEKNKSDYVVVVGPDFAGGNLEKRAEEYNVSLLNNSELIRVLEAHAKYPFNLLEIKDLFVESGIITDQVEDLLSQNQNRVSLLEKFKVVVNEITKIQNANIGYFTFESLVSREKVQELGIELDDINSIIQLLKIPFINAIAQIEANKYVFTLETKDLSNTFKQISLLIESKLTTSTLTTINNETLEVVTEESEERVFGTKYYKWEKRGSSVFAYARQENPYSHSCPLDHFKTITENIIKAYNKQNVVNNDTIFQMLVATELSPNRLFKGKAEEYKIRLIFGILELEGLINWTGSLRPIEYTLEKEIEELIKWRDKIYQ